MAHVPRALTLAAAIVTGLVASLPAGAVSSPPVVSAIQRVAPAGLSQHSTAEDVALAFDGTHTVAAWIVGGLLQVERFDAALDPVGPRVVLESIVGDGTFWGDVVVAHGGGKLLVVAATYVRSTASAPVRAFLVGPGNEVRAVALGPTCPSPDDRMTNRVGAAWNGSRFLVSANCEGGVLRTMTVSAAGQVANARTMAGGGGEFGANEVVVASAGGAFAVVYEVEKTLEGRGDVLIRRFGATGNPLGPAIVIETGVGMVAVEITAAGAGDRYLIAWADAEHTAGTLRYRAMSASGQFGAVHRIQGLTGAAPTLAAGPASSWRLAHRDAPGVMVTTLGSGLEVGATRRVIPLEDHEYVPAPAVTRTAGGALVVATADRDLVQRRVDADGDPAGSPRLFGRVPVEQTCENVAAGSDQFLVVWQELRQPRFTNVYGQRFAASGSPLGGRITISAEKYNQFCPHAAWDGSRWLVAWTDERNGNKDVYATTVGASGEVAPAGGLAVSARAASQQSPSVAFNGTDFVVAWADLRNGNQDMYAARISPTLMVRDPNGIPVTTSPDPAFQPNVSSLDGSTLVAWTSGQLEDFHVGGRVLAADGSFRSAPRRIEETGGRISTTAGSTRFVVSTVTTGLRTVSIDPATGTPGTVRTVDGTSTLQHAHIAWDGDAVVFAATSSRRTDDLDRIERPLIGVLSSSRTTVESQATLTTDPYPQAIATLATGVALVAGTDRGRVVAARVA